MMRPRILDCSDETQLGGSKEVSTDATTPSNPPWSRIMSLPGTTELCSPEVITCSFSVSESNNPVYVRDQFSRLQALVKWGSLGGTGNDAILDVRHGSRISLEASFLNVSVRMVGTGPKRTIAVSPGYGSIGKAPPITLTGDAIVLVAGVASAAIKVPTFASELAVMSIDSPFLARTIAANFYNSDDAAATLYYTEDVDSGEIPLAASAEFVRFTSAANTTIIPVWSLAL